MAILDACEKYYGTRDLYKLLDVDKKAQPQQIKKAYYRLSMLVHPDRVPDEQKDEATEKFKTLAKVYQTLSEEDKKKLYDEQGVIADDDDDVGDANAASKLQDWLKVWQTIFKPITTEDINNYHKDYVGSPLERMDIKKAYLNGKGCKNYIFNHVPFMRIDDEPRIDAIVMELIESGDVPEFEQFTKEPAQKRNRRHKKYAREAEEAKEIAKHRQQNFADLEKQMLSRRQERESNFNSLLDRLAQKYGDEGDDEDYATVSDDSEEVAPKKKRSAAKGKPKALTAKNEKAKKGKGNK